MALFRATAGCKAMPPLRWSFCLLGFALGLTGCAGGAGTARATALRPAPAFVYVVNRDSHSVTAYRIEAASGHLTPLGSVTTGRLPEALAVAVRQRALYVANEEDGSISETSMCPIRSRRSPHPLARNPRRPTSVGCRGGSSSCRCRAIPWISGFEGGRDPLLMPRPPSQRAVLAAFHAVCSDGRFVADLSPLERRSSRQGGSQRLGWPGPLAVCRLLRPPGAAPVARA